MKVRYLGTSQGYNEILGLVEPGQIYEVPKDSEARFRYLGDYDVISDKKEKKLKVDEGE